MSQEQIQIQEIDRVTWAINHTKSEKLKRDYTKYKKRLQRELKEYRRLKYGKADA